MASTFQQQSTLRKFIYFGLILALFTCSLLHRNLVIRPEADALQMRESARGKADLTDSALRLTLSGVRGVAVTSLWLACIERQKRHEWNEMEVLVESLTRLQPRFVSPWLFQGWNLAFNVAVECDRPRDKYYYISRGIMLLARGEEKNDPGMAVPPQPWPASPEMRFQIGFTYQLKIGQGDENKTQRCLMELSTIPLKDRDPQLFWQQGPRGRQINLDAFMKFCRSYPRLVRRLKERLSGFSYPEDIVGFLEENKDLPTRFEDRSNLDDDKRLQEFPTLPPQCALSTGLYQYPDWRQMTLSSANSDFDVFVCMRAWYTYGQVPMPPPYASPGADEPPFDRSRYRTPKMASIIFRTYPARAEAYFGEHLQLDGWFDDSGWLIKDWFDPVLNTEQKLHGGIQVGEGDRFNSGKAWGRAYDMYKDVGERNGLYIEPRELEKWKALAVSEGGNSFASKKLYGYQQYRDMTNYPNFLFQTQVERLPETVAARKAIFEANRVRLAGDSYLALKIYSDEALPQWLDILMRNPDFRGISTIQEDTYELEADYFKLVQFHYKKDIEKLVIEAAVLPAVWPQPGFVVPIIDPAGQLARIWPQEVLRQFIKEKKLKVFPIRDVEGMFDQLFILNLPPHDEAPVKALAEALARQALWPPAPTERGVPDFAFGRFVVWPPPQQQRGAPEIGLGTKATWPPTKWVAPTAMSAASGGGMAAGWPQPVFLMLSSAEERRILTVVASHRHPPAGQGWTPLIPLPVVEQSRERINWMRPPRPAGPTPQPKS